MKPKKKTIETLEAFIFASRRATGEQAVPDGWRDSVMAEVRRSAAAGVAAGAAPEAGGNGEALLVRLSWRFAAAAGVAALVFLVHLYLFGIIDYSELIASYIANPIDYLI